MYTEHAEQSLQSIAPIYGVDGQTKNLQLDMTVIFGIIRLRDILKVSNKLLGFLRCSPLWFDGRPYMVLVILNLVLSRYSCLACFFHDGKDKCLRIVSGEINSSWVSATNTQNRVKMGVLYMIVTKT